MSRPGGLDGGLPKVHAPLRQWFLWYAARYTKKRFHTIRWVQAGESPSASPSMVFYSNHASWWDPMMAAVLSQVLAPKRVGYAPIDSEALARYGFFRRLGFFGVNPRSPLGGRAFLSISSAVLRTPNTFLWVTPQGRFSDVRERPLGFAAGLRRLQERFPETPFIPVAFEYPFWEERTPEALAWVGAPVTGDLEEELVQCMDALAALSIQRESAPFTELTRRDVGVGGVYDMWRRARFALRNGNGALSHGQR